MLRKTPSALLHSALPGSIIQNRFLLPAAAQRQWRSTGGRPHRGSVSHVAGHHSCQVSIPMPLPFRRIFSAAVIRRLVSGLRFAKDLTQRHSCLLSLSPRMAPSVSVPIGLLRLHQTPVPRTSIRASTRSSIRGPEVQIQLPTPKRTRRQPTPIAEPPDRESTIRQPASLPSYFCASAPLTTSRISVVIAAWRALLY